MLNTGKKKKMESSNGRKRGERVRVRTWEVIFWAPLTRVVRGGPSEELGILGGTEW